MLFNLLLTCKNSIQFRAIHYTRFMRTANPIFVRRFAVLVVRYEFDIDANFCVKLPTGADVSSVVRGLFVFFWGAQSWFVMSFISCHCALGRHMHRVKYHAQ